MSRLDRHKDKPKPIQTAAESIPPVTLEMVNSLKRLFPDRCHDEGLPRESIDRYAGRVDVVRFLELVHKHQIAKGGKTDVRK